MEKAPWRQPRRRRAAAVLDALEEAYPHARCELAHENAFQLLFATILSAQCTDERVNIVTARLFPTLKSPADVLAMGPEALEAAIRDVGLFRSKAKSIYRTCEILVHSLNGEVPSGRTALEALPGVGRKTAGVVLSNAFGVPALPVDTHVFRVAARLGLSLGPSPEETERQLCRVIPKARWSRAHHLFIFHGRRCCHARHPQCHSCPVLAWCPHGQAQVR